MSKVDDQEILQEMNQKNFIDWCRSVAARNRNYLLWALDGLDDQDLIWRPRHDANPIAWILWHIGEFEESLLWEYYHQEAIYRFQKSCSESDFTDLPSKNALLNYLESTRKVYFAFLANLSVCRFDEVIETRHWSKLPFCDFVLLPIHHEMHHAGQIAYLRRLMGKPLPKSNFQNTNF